MVYRISCIVCKRRGALMRNPKVDSLFWKTQVLEFCLILVMFYLNYHNVV